MTTWTSLISMHPERHWKACSLSENASVKQIWEFTNARTAQERTNSLHDTWMKLSSILLIAR